MQNERPAIMYVLLSRKFWMAMIGLVLVVVTTWGQDPYPSDAVVTSIMGVVGAYIASVAYEDGQRAKAEAMPTTTVTTPSENVVVSTSDTPAPVRAGAPLHPGRLP